MLQIKDGKIELNKSRQLTPKQLATLNNCASESDKNRYLMSLLGLVKSRVFVPRMKKTGVDRLASKQGNSMFMLMEKLRRLNYDHKPNNKDLGQWVGVEIECIIPHQEGDGGGSCGDCDECADGNECDNYSGSNWSESEAHRWLAHQLKLSGITRACIKYDGSLSDDEGHGVEITILFNSAYGFEPLERLCSALKKAGCYVNKTCGLHVHLDARHLTVKKALKIGHSIGHALPVIKYMVGESRLTNTYCKLEVSPMRGDRYCAVNMTAYNKYKTIEIRLHQGSINAKKIINWISLLKFLGKAKLTTGLTTFQDLIDTGLSEDLVSYCESRISELNPEAWAKLMPCEASTWPRAQGPVMPASTVCLHPINGVA